MEGIEMASRQESTPAVLSESEHHGLAERLERGAVIHFPTCPFVLPAGEDHDFLLEQRLGKGHKNISYNPHTGKVNGHARGDASRTERLRGLFAGFSDSVTHWLAAALPRYAADWQLDMVSYRPEQEATRRLRLTARNDLLHVDAFPRRPTNGWRILRIFANINPSESRVWITGDPFAHLLARYGREAGLPDGRPEPLFQRCQEGLLRLIRPGRARRSVYDAFMLRFHNFLKANKTFQKTCPRQVWEFRPGAAWMVVTDTASHAVLSGRFALEHSYFLAPYSLALPEESPAALLKKTCGLDVLRRVA
jgi:hypothetical protein